MAYHAQNWYWIVGGMAQVWSSAQLTYVERSNATYAKWCLANHPTNIPSPEELIHVMQTQVRPFIMANGVTIKTPAKLSGTYNLSESAHAAITTLATSIAAGRPLPGGGTSFNFGDASGAPHAFTGPQFLAFAHACDNYLYAWNQALISNLMGKGGTYPLRTLSIKET